MTAKPKKWKPLPDGTSAAHRTLVAALRETRERSARTQAEIAKDAHQAPTTLSNHLNGGRIPDIDLLRDFYMVIEKDAAGREPLPHTLGALLDMRTHAVKKHCDCCRVGYPSAPDEADLPGPGQPASHTVRRSGVSRARRLRRQARRRELSVPQEHMRVPVPLTEGYRHPAGAAELAWAETGVVARYLADGRTRDADLLLWRAGTSYSADSLLEAVESCRSAGLRAAAETILSTAAERTDKQAVLNIAAAFSGAGRHEDLTFMLTAAARAAI
ncbi:helix-turn-helix domain-containing protein [Streptomyces sp. NPDC058637]|uniref:helix-turn-helix domain-containing protein n=1 Tax=Streptomyces sp. NPDC058637 TaxID=3346569 RepID=UPI00365BA5FF